MFTKKLTNNLSHENQRLQDYLQWHSATVDLFIKHLNTKMKRCNFVLWITCSKRKYFPFFQIFRTQIIYTPVAMTALHIFRCASISCSDGRNRLTHWLIVIYLVGIIVWSVWSQFSVLSSASLDWFSVLFYFATIDVKTVFEVPVKQQIFL